MTLSSSQIDEIVDEICPAAPVWRADPARGAGWGTVIDNRDQLFTHSFTERTAFDAGDGPLAVIGGIYAGADSRMRTGDWDLIHDQTGDPGDDCLQITANAPGMNFLVSGCAFDSTFDPVAPSKGLLANESQSQYLIEHCYARVVRDDFHENDGCLIGTMRSVLIDGAFMIVSMRNPGTEDSYPNVGHTTLEEVYIRFNCLPQLGANSSGCPVGFGGGGKIFKAGAKTGSAAHRRCLYLWEARSNNHTEDQSWRLGATYESVYVLYAPQGVPQPFFDSLPAGVTDLGSHANAYDVWLEVRDRWLNQHDCSPKDNWFGFTCSSGGTHPSMPDIGPIQDSWAYDYGPVLVDVPDDGALVADDLTLSAVILGQPALDHVPDTPRQRVARIFRNVGATAAGTVTHLGEVVTHLGEPVIHGGGTGEVEYGKVYRGTTLVFSRGSTPGTEIGNYIATGYIAAGYFAAGVPVPLAFPDARDLSSSEVSADVDVLFNDADVSGAVVTIQGAVAGATAAVLGDQRIRVTRIGTAAGSYSLTYRATTGAGYSEATLSGSIAALAVPVANDDTRSILASETTVDVNVLANDVNVGGGTVTIVGTPSGITASVVGTQVRLTRIGTAAGVYSVTYRVTTPVGSDDAVLSGSVAAVDTGSVGPIEAVNSDPLVLKSTITVAVGERQAWWGHGWGAGGGYTAAITTHVTKLTTDINATVVRLHTPENTSDFLTNYKPVWDAVKDHGVDTVFTSSYIYRAEPDTTPTAMANGISACITGGVNPTLWACTMQNEPEGNVLNAPPGSSGQYVAIVGTHQAELRARLNTLGRTAVRCLGLEWRHPPDPANLSAEYDAHSANGRLPSAFDGPGVVDGCCLHIYNESPDNLTYDSRWKTKGTNTLWSTETGNSGSPSHQARFVAGLNHGASVEIAHIGIHGTEPENSDSVMQHLLHNNGTPFPWYGAVKVIGTALRRGMRFRLCTSTDRPPGMNTTLADRMIINGARVPRQQVAAAKHPSDNRWVIVAVNRTYGTDLFENHTGAHYAAATQQLTVNVIEMAGMAREFTARRADINGVVSGFTTVNMQDGLIRFTLAPGETIALEQVSA